MKLKLIFVISLLVFYIVENAIAQSVQIDNYLSSCNERDLFSGTALVAKGDSIIFKKGFGLANREWNNNNAVDTRFDIGSLTKQFVTVITLQLIEEGKLTKEDVICRYIPEYREDIGKKVTIDQLLRHTSGIKPYVAIKGVDNILAQSLSKDDALRMLHSSDLEFESGERYRYNNSGYCILVYIIEQVTSKSFEHNLNERIFIPLEMKNSGLIKPDMIINNFAEGYVLGLGGYKKPKYLNPTNTYGAGGMYSTAEDMFLWNRSFTTHKLLPEKYDSWFFEPYFEFHLGNGHGYSWDITTLKLKENNEVVKFAHYNGAQWGYLCETARIFTDDYYIILFTNMGHNINIWSVESGIRNILLNQSYTIPLPTLSNKLSLNIFDKSFNKIIENTKNDAVWLEKYYSVNEQSLNMLGYQLLWNNYIEKSLKVLELNTILFPNSANAFDSLGEIFMTLGNKKLAILNFNKSLELNPENINAKKMIEKLTITN